MKLEEKQKLFNKGIELFNSQKFYEAHEEWEQIWLKERGELRNFYQGVIILAGALHHVQKGRFGPAKKALDKSFAKLSEYRSHRSYKTYIDELLEQIDKFSPDSKDWPQLHGLLCHK